MEPKYWPFIYVIANLWKYTGNGSIVYIAAIAGFDPEIYEAASIDGAGRWKQTMPDYTDAGTHDDSADDLGCRKNIQC